MQHFSMLKEEVQEKRKTLITEEERIAVPVFWVEKSKHMEGLVFSRRMESPSVVTEKRTKTMNPDLVAAMVVGGREVLFGWILLTQWNRKQCHQIGGLLRKWYV